MKKGLIIIYLSLLISSCNSEERKALDSKVKSSNNVLEDKNIKWVELTDQSDRDNVIIKTTKEGITYVDRKGKKYICGKIKNGKKVGKWNEWYPNTQKKSEVKYMNGKAEGKYISWDEDGRKEWEGNYLNGKKEGKWIHYYGNGSNDEITYENGEEK